MLPDVSRWNLWMSGRVVLSTLRLDSVVQWRRKVSSKCDPRVRSLTVSWCLFPAPLQTSTSTDAPTVDPLQLLHRAWLVKMCFCFRLRLRYFLVDYCTFCTSGNWMNMVITSFSTWLWRSVRYHIRVQAQKSEFTNQCSIEKIVWSFFA